MQLHGFALTMGGLSPGRWERFPLAELDLQSGSRRTTGRSWDLPSEIAVAFDLEVPEPLSSILPLASEDDAA